MPFTTIPLQTQARDAAVALLEGYKASASLRYTVYGGRPRYLDPKSPGIAFIDSIRETIRLSGPLMRLRTVFVEMVVLHGFIDTVEAAQRRDAFVDGFADWVYQHPDAAGAATLTGDTITITDVPNFVPAWLPEEERRVYFATNVSLEVDAGG